MPIGDSRLRPFRYGLVGAGRMGRTHLRALEGSDVVAVTAVAEPDEQGRAAVADRYGLAAFAALEVMLESDAIDGILVATPTDSHVDVIAAAVAVGVPVLCEKPCGRDPLDARRALELASATGVPVQVAYWRRYVPVLQELRKQIASGGVGNVLTLVCTQWDGEPPPPAFRLTSGGIFIDMGVHEFDQARWLLDSDLATLGAVGTAPTATAPRVPGALQPDLDGAQLVGQTTSGVPVAVSLGRYYQGGDMVRVEVFGTDEHVVHDVLTPDDGEAVQLLALERQACAFADYVAGGPCTGATIDDAVAALEIASSAQALLPPQGAPAEVTLA